MMKIGLTSYSCNAEIMRGEMSILDVMRFAKSKNAAAIELVPFGFTLYDDKTGEMNEPLIREIRETSREIDLPLSNYAVLGDLLRWDRDARMAEVERLKRHIDVAHKLGLSTMRHDISSFRRPLETNTPLDFEREFPMAVETCRLLADYAATGKEYKAPFEWGKAILISLVIGFVIAIIVVLVMKGKLKSVRMKDNATDYTVPGSMNITDGHELYLYSTVVATPKPRNDSSSGSGGSSHGGGGGRV